MEDVEVFQPVSTGTRVPRPRMPDIDEILDQTFTSTFGEPFDPFMIFGRRWDIHNGNVKYETCLFAFLFSSLYLCFYGYYSNE